MTESRNIAATMGGWSVRHRVIAIVGWSRSSRSPWGSGRPRVSGR